MSFVRSLLFAVGYCIFLGPPRAFEMGSAHQSSKGELANQPFWFILTVETLLRAMLLISISTVVEASIGAHWYAWLRVDQSLSVLLTAGTIHALAYLYLYFERGRKRKRFVGVVYRLIRNCCYALTPGLAVVTLWLLFDGQRPTPQSTDEQIALIYLSVLLVFVLIGVAEALVVKRRPSGLGGVV